MLIFLQFRGWERFSVELLNKIQLDSEQKINHEVLFFSFQSAVSWTSRTPYCCLPIYNPPSGRQLLVLSNQCHRHKDTGSATWHWGNNGNLFYLRWPWDVGARPLPPGQQQKQGASRKGFDGRILTCMQMVVACNAALIWCCLPRPKPRTIHTNCCS